MLASSHRADIYNRALHGWQSQKPTHRRGERSSATRIYYVCSFAFSARLCTSLREEEGAGPKEKSDSRSHTATRHPAPRGLRTSLSLALLSSDLVDVSTSISPFELVSCTHVSSFGVLPPSHKQKERKSGNIRGFREETAKRDERVASTHSARGQRPLWDEDGREI